MTETEVEDRYAVIGNPIGHSRSPQIHARLAQATGQRMHYAALEGRIGHFAEEVARFRRAGGKGLNVTAPFKMDAFALAARRSASARAAQVANALKWDDDGVMDAENFDGAGLVRDVTRNLRRPLRGQRILLLGAGGAARGVLMPLLHEVPAALWIANRTAQKAHALAAAAHAAGGAGLVQACGWNELQSAAAPPFDVVFNTTSASWQAGALPLPAGIFAAGALAYELAYGQGMTAFLQQARQGGAAQLADGVGMLVEQAALTFAWWRGVEVPPHETQALIAQLAVPLES